MIKEIFENLARNHAKTWTFVMAHQISLKLVFPSHAVDTNKYKYLHILRITNSTVQIHNLISLAFLNFDK